MKISAGDAVTMKSSKVVMTVKKVGDADGDVVCGWHDELGAYHEHSFPQIMLAPTAESKAAHDKADADRAKAEADAKAKADADGKSAKPDASMRMWPDIQ